jgi:tripartite-type tricarboxylate transporter receptor subunit TctC
MIRVVGAVAVACSLALGAHVASAQTAPEPMQLIVPYGPGNGLDLLAREFAEVLRTQLGTTVVVENREGAGGVVGTSYAARAPANGRAMLVTAHPPFASAPLVQKTAAYDPLKSFLPVARVGSVPLVAVTSSRSPLKSFADIAPYLKANPDKGSYASSGIGSPGQIYTELIKKATGLPLQEVPYKSTSQALTDVIGGQVMLSLVSYPAASQHIKNGALRLLAVGSPIRLKDYPDVPTMAEAIGQPGFEAGVWYGFLLPAAASAETVRRLHAEIAKALVAPSVVAMMERSSISPHLQSPSEFAASLRTDVEVARKLLGSTNLIEAK